MYQIGKRNTIQNEQRNGLRTKESIHQEALTILHSYIPSKGVSIARLGETPVCLRHFRFLLPQITLQLDLSQHSALSSNTSVRPSQRPPRHPVPSTSHYLVEFASPSYPYLKSPCSLRICLPGVFQCLKLCLAESITGSQGRESGAQVSWPTQRLKGRGRPSLSAVLCLVLSPIHCFLNLLLPQLNELRGLHSSRHRREPSRGDEATAKRETSSGVMRKPPATGHFSGRLCSPHLSAGVIKPVSSGLSSSLSSSSSSSEDSSSDGSSSPQGVLSISSSSVLVWKRSFIHSFSKRLLCTHDASSCCELKGWKSKRTIISAQRELTFYWGTYCSHISGKCMPFFRLWNFQTPGSLTMTINYLHTSQPEVRQPWPIPEIQQHWFQTRPRRVVSQSHLLGVCPSHQHGTQRNSSARDRTQVSSTAKRRSKRWSPGETSRYTVQN